MATISKLIDLEELERRIGDTLESPNQYTMQWRLKELKTAIEGLAVTAGPDSQTAASAWADMNQTLDDLLLKLTEFDNSYDTNSAGYATEATLTAANTNLDQIELILAAIRDQGSSGSSDTTGLATEATLASYQPLIDEVETVLKSIESKLGTVDTTGLATEATLALINSKMQNVDTSALATEATMSTMSTNVADLENILTAIESTVATETTLNEANLRLEIIDDVLKEIRDRTAPTDVSALATEATLGTVSGNIADIEGLITILNSKVTEVDTSGLGTEATLLSIDGKLGNVDTSSLALESTQIVGNATLTSIDSKLATLSTDGLATELTLSNTKAVLDVINGKITAVDTTPLALEATQIQIRDYLDQVEPLLTQIANKPDADTSALATETTLQSIDGKLATVDTTPLALESTQSLMNDRIGDVTTPAVGTVNERLERIRAEIENIGGSGLASEATLSIISQNIADTETLLNSLDGKIVSVDTTALATEATLASIQAYNTTTQQPILEAIRDKSTAASILDENGEPITLTNPFPVEVTGITFETGNVVGVTNALEQRINPATEETSSNISADTAAMRLRIDELTASNRSSFNSLLEDTTILQQQITDGQVLFTDTLGNITASDVQPDAGTVLGRLFDIHKTLSQNTDSIELYLLDVRTAVKDMEGTFLNRQVSTEPKQDIQIEQLNQLTLDLNALITDLDSDMNTRIGEVDIDQNIVPNTLFDRLIQLKTTLNNSRTVLSTENAAQLAELEEIDTHLLNFNQDFDNALALANTNLNTLITETNDLEEYLTAFNNAYLERTGDVVAVPAPNTVLSRLKAINDTLVSDDNATLTEQQAQTKELQDIEADIETFILDFQTRTGELLNPVTGTTHDRLEQLRLQVLTADNNIQDDLEALLLDFQNRTGSDDSAVAAGPATTHGRLEQIRQQISNADINLNQGIDDYQASFENLFTIYDNAFDAYALDLQTRLGSYTGIADANTTHGRLEQIRAQVQTLDESNDANTAAANAILTQIDTDLVAYNDEYRTTSADHLQTFLDTFGIVDATGTVAPGQNTVLDKLQDIQTQVETADTNLNQGIDDFQTSFEGLFSVYDQAFDDYDAAFDAYALDLQTRIGSYTGIADPLTTHGRLESIRQQVEDADINLNQGIDDFQTSFEGLFSVYDQAFDDYVSDFQTRTGSFDPLVAAAEGTTHGRLEAIRQQVEDADINLNQGIDDFQTSFEGLFTIYDAAFDAYALDLQTRMGDIAAPAAGTQLDRLEQIRQQVEDADINLNQGIDDFQTSFETRFDVYQGTFNDYDTSFDAYALDLQTRMGDIATPAAGTQLDRLEQIRSQVETADLNLNQGIDDFQLVWTTDFAAYQGTFDAFVTDLSDRIGSYDPLVDAAPSTTHGRLEQIRAQIQTLDESNDANSLTFLTDYQDRTGSFDPLVAAAPDTTHGRLEQIRQQVEDADVNLNANIDDFQQNWNEKFDIYDAAFDAYALDLQTRTGSYTGIADPLTTHGRLESLRAQVQSADETNHADNEAFLLDYQTRTGSIDPLVDAAPDTTHGRLEQIRQQVEDADINLNQGIDDFQLVWTTDFASYQGTFDQFVADFKTITGSAVAGTPADPDTTHGRLEQIRQQIENADLNLNQGIDDFQTSFETRFDVYQGTFNDYDTAFDAYALDLQTRMGDITTPAAGTQLDRLEQIRAQVQAADEANQAFLLDYQTRTGSYDPLVAAESDTTHGRLEQIRQQIETLDDSNDTNTTNTIAAINNLDSDLIAYNTDFDERVGDLVVDPNALTILGRLKNISDTIIAQSDEREDLQQGIIDRVQTFIEDYDARTGNVTTEISGLVPAEGTVLARLKDINDTLGDTTTPAAGTSNSRLEAIRQEIEDSNTDLNANIDGFQNDWNTKFDTYAADFAQKMGSTSTPAQGTLLDRLEDIRAQVQTLDESNDNNSNTFLTDYQDRTGSFTAAASPLTTHGRLESIRQQVEDADNNLNAGIDDFQLVWDTKFTAYDAAFDAYALDFSTKVGDITTPAAGTVNDRLEQLRLQLVVNNANDDTNTNAINTNIDEFQTSFENLFTAYDSSFDQYVVDFKTITGSHTGPADANTTHGRLEQIRAQIQTADTNLQTDIEALITDYQNRTGSFTATADPLTTHGRLEAIRSQVQTADTNLNQGIDDFQSVWDTKFTAYDAAFDAYALDLQTRIGDIATPAEGTMLDRLEDIRAQLVVNNTNDDTNTTALNANIDEFQSDFNTKFAAYDTSFDQYVADFKTITGSIDPLVDAAPDTTHGRLEQIRAQIQTADNNLQTDIEAFITDYQDRTGSFTAVADANTTHGRLEQIRQQVEDADVNINQGIDDFQLVWDTKFTAYDTSFDNYALDLQTRIGDIVTPAEGTLLDRLEDIRAQLVVNNTNDDTNTVAINDNIDGFQSDFNTKFDTYDAAFDAYALDLQTRMGTIAAPAAGTQLDRLEQIRLQLVTNNANDDTNTVAINDNIDAFQTSFEGLFTAEDFATETTLKAFSDNWTATVGTTAAPAAGTQLDRLEKIRSQVQTADININATLGDVTTPATGTTNDRLEQIRAQLATNNQNDDTNTQAINDNVDAFQVSLETLIGPVAADASVPQNTVMDRLIDIRTSITTATSDAAQNTTDIITEINEFNADFNSNLGEITLTDAAPTTEGTVLRRLYDIYNQLKTDDNATLTEQKLQTTELQEIEEDVVLLRNAYITRTGEVDVDANIVPNTVMDRLRQVRTSVEDLESSNTTQNAANLSELQAIDDNVTGYRTDFGNTFAVTNQHLLDIVTNTQQEEGLQQDIIDAVTALNTSYDAHTGDHLSATPDVLTVLGRLKAINDTLVTDDNATETTLQAYFDNFVATMGVADPLTPAAEGTVLDSLLDIETAVTTADTNINSTLTTKLNQVDATLVRIESQDYATKAKQQEQIDLFTVYDASFDTYAADFATKVGDITTPAAGTVNDRLEQIRSQVETADTNNVSNIDDLQAQLITRIGEVDIDGNVVQNTIMDRLIDIKTSINDSSTSANQNTADIITAVNSVDTNVTGFRNDFASKTGEITATNTAPTTEGTILHRLYDIYDQLRTDDNATLTEQKIQTGHLSAIDVDIDELQVSLETRIGEVAEDGLVTPNTVMDRLIDVRTSNEDIRTTATTENAAQLGELQAIDTNITDYRGEFATTFTATNDKLDQIIVNTQQEEDLQQATTNAVNAFNTVYSDTTGNVTVGVAPTAGTVLGRLYTVEEAIESASTTLTSENSTALTQLGAIETAISSFQTDFDTRFDAERFSTFDNQEIEIARLDTIITEIDGLEESATLLNSRIGSVADDATISTTEPNTVMDRLRQIRVSIDSASSTSTTNKNEIVAAVNAVETDLNAFNTNFSDTLGDVTTGATAPAEGTLLGRLRDIHQDLVNDDNATLTEQKIQTGHLSNIDVDIDELQTSLENHIGTIDADANVKLNSPNTIMDRLIDIREEVQTVHTTATSENSAQLTKLGDLETAVTNFDSEFGTTFTVTNQHLADIVTNTQQEEGLQQGIIDAVTALNGDLNTYRDTNFANFATAFNTYDAAFDTYAADFAQKMGDTAAPAAGTLLSRVEDVNTSVDTVDASVQAFITSFENQIGIASPTVAAAEGTVLDSIFDVEQSITTLDSNAANNTLTLKNAIDATTTAVNTFDAAFDARDLATESTQELNRLQLVAANTTLDSVDGKITTFNNDFATRTGDLVATPDALSILGRLKSIADNTSDLEIQTDELEGKLDTLNGTVAGFQTSNETTQGTIDSSIQSLLASFEAQMGIASATIPAAEGTVLDSLLDIETDIEATNTALGTLNSKDFATEATQLRNETLLTDIKTQTDTVESELISANTTLTSLDGKDFSTFTQQQVIDTSIQSLLSEFIKDIGVASATVDPAANTVLDRLKTIDESLQTNGGKLDAANASLTSIDTDTTTIIGHVDGIETSLTSANTTLTSIDGKDFATAAKQDTINASLTTIDNDLTTRLGDAVDAPAVFTVLGRLKEIDGSIDTLTANSGTQSTAEIAAINAVTTELQGYRTDFLAEDFATESTQELNRVQLVAVNTNIDELQTDLATRIGEVSLTPTANTVMDRLRDLQSTAGLSLTKQTEIDTAIDTFSGNFDSRDLATNATLIEVRDYLDTVETQLTSFAAANTGDLGTVNTSINTFKTDFDTRIGEVAAAPTVPYTVLWRLKDIADSVDSSNTALVTELQAIDSNITGYRGEFLAEDFATENTLSLVKTELANANTSLATLITQTDGLEVNTDELEVKIDATTAAVTALQGTNTTENGLITTAVGDLETDLASRIGDVNLAPAANTMMDRLLQIETGVDELKAANTAENADQLSKLTELDAAFDAYTVAFTGEDFATQTTLAAADTKLATLITATDTLESQLTTINTSITTFDSAFDNRDLATLTEQQVQTGHLSAIDVDIDELQTSLETRIGDVTLTPVANTVMDRLNRIENEIKDVETAVGTNTSAIAAFNLDFDNRDLATSALQGTINTSVLDVNTSVDALQTDFNTKVGEVSATAPGANTILGRLKDINDSVVTFDAAFDARDLATETTLGSVLSALGTTNTNLTSLINNTDTLEINTDGIETGLADVVSAVNTASSTNTTENGTLNTSVLDVNTSVDDFKTAWQNTVGPVDTDANVSLNAPNTVMDRLIDIKTEVTAAGAGADANTATLAGKLDTINTSVTTFDAAFDARDLATETTLAAADTKLGTLITELDGVEETLTTIDTAIDTFSANFDSRDLATLTEQQTQTTHLSAIDVDIDELETALVTRIGDVTTVSDPVTGTMMWRLLQIDTAIDELKSSGITNSGNEQIAIGDLETVVTGFRTSFETLFNAEDFATQTTLAAADTKLGTLITELDQVEESLTAANTTLNTIAAIDYATETTQLVNKAQLIDVNANLVDFESQLVSRIGDVAVAPATNTLMDRILQIENGVDELKVANSNENALIEATLNSIETTQAAFKTGFDNRDLATSAKQDTINTSVLDVNTSVDALQTDFNTKIGEVSATPTSNTVMWRLAEIDDAVDELKTTNTTNSTAEQTAIAAVETAIAAFNTAFDNRDLATETTLNTVNTSVLDVNTSVDSLQTTNTAENALLNTSILDVNTSVDDLQASMETRIGEVSATPTADTMMDRLKRIEEAIGTNNKTRVERDPFGSLIKYEADVGQELRREDGLLTEDYHGRAPDGSSEGAAVWEVVRFDKDVNGNITRTRYKTGVAWTNRATAGW